MEHLHTLEMSMFTIFVLLWNANRKPLHKSEQLKKTKSIIKKKSTKEQIKIIRSNVVAVLYEWITSISTFPIPLQDTFFVFSPILIKSLEHKKQVLDMSVECLKCQSSKLQ